MGYTSFKDFFRSFFGIWYAEIIFTLSVLISMIYFGLESFCSCISLMYDPINMMILLWAALLGDWISGVYLALKNHDFRTDKAKRILPTALGQTMLLVGLYYGEIHLVSELGKGEERVFHYFRIFLHNYMYMVILMSMAVNLYRAKIITWGVISIMEKYIDRYKIKSSEPEKIKND